ncbi:MAG: isopeptide-forming domain-containing fimbrial protein [Oscillospiraceae bacterium]|nr:isopeptide-forming domain-containing fimbrial protein [Oscillospiraceae bacterium]
MSSQAGRSSTTLMSQSAFRPRSQDSISGTGGYVSIDSNGHVTWTGGSTSTGEIAATFAALALNTSTYITPTYSAVVASTSGNTEVSLSFTGLPYGYYLVDSSLGALCALDSNTPSATITDKNASAVPTVDKKVMEDYNSTYGESNVADYTEVVKFMTTISNAYSMSNLVLRDEMDDVFELDTTSFTVYLGGSGGETLIDSSNYTVTTTGLSDNCTFEISFSDTYLAGINSTDTIVVYYEATLLSTATAGYIFYVVGGILVIGAIVLLITKKMKNDD